MSNQVEVTVTTSQKMASAKNWLQFCNEFSAANRYRKASIAMANGAGSQVWVERELPFLGLSAIKHKGTSDMLLLTATQYDPERLSEWQVSIPGPVQMDVERSYDRTVTQLSVTGKDGSVIDIIFSDRRENNPYRWLIEKTAETLHSLRGRPVGQELTDWLEAEQRVRLAGLTAM